MKTFLLALAVALSAGSLFGAGVQSIIKERAKELRDQNNVRQGVAPPTQPGQTPPPAAAAPPTPAQQSLTRFQNRLAGIKATTQVSAEQKRELSKDLLGAAQGTKPAPATVDKLIDELTSALSEQPLPSASLARFVQELDAVLNPAKYPQAKMPAIFQDVQAIFQANGLSRTKAVALSEQVKALAAEAQH